MASETKSTKTTGLTAQFDKSLRIDEQWFEALRGDATEESDE
jgi:hypothetical protein